MTPEQFQAARLTLKWTHKTMAHVLGVHRRTCHRYSTGEVDIPPTTARLLLLLVRLRLTVDASMFADIVMEVLQDDQG